MARRFLAGSLVLNSVLLAVVFWRFPTPRAEGSGNESCNITHGDLNGDQQIDLSDAAYLIDFIYYRGPSPIPAVVADPGCTSRLEEELAECRASLDECSKAPPAEPRSPSGLAATTGDSSVVLDWTDNTEPDLASYSVYRSIRTGGGYIRIASGLLQSSYADSTVMNSAVYHYVVTAVNDAGIESAFSGEVVVSPRARALLINPPHSIALSWNLPVENSDGTPCNDLAGFRVYWGTASRQYTQSRNVGNAIEATIGDLAPGDYYFSVTAYDVSGNESSLADELPATIN